MNTTTTTTAPTLDEGPIIIAGFLIFRDDDGTPGLYILNADHQGVFVNPDGSSYPVGG